MRHLSRPLAALIVALLFAGCGGPPQDPTAPSSDDVKRDAAEALDTTKRYLAEQKARAIAGIESQLTELKQAIDELDIEAESEKARAALEEMRAELTQQTAKLEAELAEAREAGGKAWTEIEKGLQDAWTDLEQAYARAAQHFATPAPEGDE